MTMGGRMIVKDKKKKKKPGERSLIILITHMTI